MKLAKCKPTEPTKNIHTPNNDSRFEYTTATKKQNITKSECEKVIEHFKTRLEENYENISTDSDKKSKSDNDKLKLKLKIKRLEKNLEMQKKDLVSKYENLKKENEILKKEIYLYHCYTSLNILVNTLILTKNRTEKCKSVNAR